jgi:hypothetical protein
VAWFFAETYAFRLILSATRYFETGIDPFGAIKRRELDSGSPFLPVMRFFGAGPGQGLLFQAAEAGATASTTPRRDPGEDERAILEEALHLSMWSNRADISFVAGGALDHSRGRRELLLADYGGAAAERLAQAAGPIHIILDNSGAELAGDLVFALTLNILTGASVVLHPKFYPTYVSDTIVDDIYRFLAAASAHPEAAVRRFAHAASDAINNGTFTLAPDPYWCETRFLHELPPRLVTPFEHAAMVVVKGDFNYRRAMRDRIWPAGTEPAHAMGLADASGEPARLTSVPWLFLRTMKSDCLVGIDGKTMDDLDRDVPGWRTDGRRGVIQLVG